MTASLPLRIGLCLGLVLATAALSLLDIRDFDYWWHLKTGELILAFENFGAYARAADYDFFVLKAGVRWGASAWTSCEKIFGLPATMFPDSI